MSGRIPRYESHIRPMFRPLDRQSMAGRFDLWNYEHVVANAAKIIRRIDHATHGSMPPEEFGGPWPDEWISLFLRWRDLGFPRLESPVDGIRYQVARISATDLLLMASGSNPGTGYQVWIEPAFATWEDADFTLYREPPAEAAGGGPVDFEVEIDFPDRGFGTILVNGHQVVIPPAGPM